LKKFTTRGP